MANIMTVSKGHDLDYAWRQVAAGARAEKHRGAGYYLSAAEAGEPPGVWWGPAAEALGLVQGAVIDRAEYDLLFGQRKTADGTRLGRAPGDGAAKAHKIYQRLAAAEPHADEGRRRELRMEAQRQVRQSPLYYDLTVSLSKSISVFHASFGENVRQALMRGDRAEAARWAACVEDMDAAISEANNAALAYIQREAGYVRVGTHAGRIDGRETGKWLEADLVAASWFQHSSRDGDPQLHTHNQVAHAARTREDGRWRAPDSRGYFEHARAAAAIGALHLEAALTRRFGLEWVPRADGQGYEIKGISAEVMDAFSSRRQDIDRVMAEELVPRFRASYDRAPTQAEMASLRQDANLATRHAKPEGAIDWDAMHAGWAAKLARIAGVDLASVARDLTQRHAGAHAGPRANSEAEIARAAGKALTKVSAEKASWTRADLLAHVGKMLPRNGADPASQAALAEQVADRALAGEFDPVVCLEAPSAVTVPASLLRADGRSVYQRHGTARYATRAQMTAEEQLVELAQTQAVPALEREYAARMLGADAATLEDALAGHADDASGVLTRSGLRLDQAAAAFRALTSGRLAELINAPAGSGKTTTATAMARAWERAGQVVGIAPSQAARNTLAKGIAESYNFAQFLGHLPGRRGARGAVRIGPGTLAVADEGSMFSTRDLLDIIRHVASHGGKLVIAGDTGQLTAVEHGGGMSLLAHVLGYAQLAEPVRFRAQWERDASLRLRAGDASVLTDYADHGRLRCAPLEATLDTAAAAYVARALEGRDVLLVVQDHATRRELSRRIRGELMHLGQVDPGRSAAIADGQRVSAGDLVMCTKNDNRQATGDGQTLSNKDLLQVVRITDRGQLVLRRVLDADPETGARRLSDHVFTYGSRDRFEPGYAVTTHCAQSRTVRSGMEVITGSEDRQSAYVGLSRGTDENLAFVVTPSPKIADPLPVTRPAPELARHRRLEAEHQAAAPVRDAGEDALDAGMAVLADVLERDGAELSALEYQQRQLSNADHLGMLHAIWQAETWEARSQRYREMVMAELPPGYDGELSHQARWLFRTLRGAELAGLDPPEVLRQAVSAGSLQGSRDVASVIDARIRKAAGSQVPLPPLPWAEQVPAIADPERQQFVSDLAAAMDARRARIGEHAAAAALPWATSALGPVPQHPVDRLAWQGRAAAIGAYRETYGFDHPSEPIGAEPAAGESPDKRAMWHEAFRALGAAEGTDLRGKADGSLWLMRDTYEAETAWAPRYVAPVLGFIRRGAEDAAMAATRSDAEADAAADESLAGRHRQRAAESRAREADYRLQEQILARADAEWHEHQRATEPQRRLAVAADTELRRRHPELRIGPLTSSAPEPVSDDEHAEAARGDAVPGWVARLAGASREFDEQIEARQNVMIPDEDPDYAPLGEAFPAWRAPGRDAILQPPQPDMPASPAVLERAAGRDYEPEGAG